MSVLSKTFGALALANAAWFVSEAAGQSPTLDQIRSSKALSIAYDPDAQPFSYIAPSSPATAAPQGYSVDLCRTVADQFKEQLKFPDLKGGVCHGQLGEPFLALALRRDDSDFRLAVDTALSHIYRRG